MSFDFAVVGGGISGMVAAHSLLRAGASVTLVEKTGRLGGIVETNHDEGFVIESGPDSFVAGKGSMLGLADDLGLTDEVVFSRPDSQKPSIWWEGALHALPGGLVLMVPSRLSDLFASSLLSRRAKMRVLADLALPRSRSGDEDESLASFVSRRLGSEVLEKIAQPLVAGIHGAEPETLSLRASFPRLLEMERQHRSLILAARRIADPESSMSGYFASFRAGMSQLIARLTAALDGVELRLSTAVTVLETEGSGYRLSFDHGPSVVADGVVVATPAPVAGRLLGGLAAKAAQALRGIDQVSIASITFAYHADDLPHFEGSGFVVPSAQKRGIRGVTYLSHKWPGRVPGPDFSLLRAFVGPDLALADQLDRMVADEMDAMIGVKARPLRTWVRVHAQGLHRYTLGHLGRVAAAEAALAACPGLALAGAGFHGVGLNECVESGRRAAALLVGASVDETAATLPGGGRS